MSLNLITDRTAADLAAAREIIAKVQRGETLTEAEQSQFDAGLRGCYNASDLNRVEAAVKSIAAELNAAGYAVEVGETKHTTVPEGYTILEYIQSTGTQYIDSGFKPGNTTQLSMDFEPTTLPASHVMAAGARNSSNGYTEQFVIGWAGHKSPAVWRSDFGDSQVSFPATVSGAIRHQLDKDGATCEMDDTTVTNDESTFTCAYTLYLFAGNQNNEVVSQISMRLYTCRIYDNGTLVRKYIPCRNPDGEVGLYDTITQSFYGNAGTGAFTAGTEIETESHDWQTADIVRLSQWRQYLANVQALRDAYTALSTTPELPLPTDKLGIEGANNIERVLADIDTLISCMIASYRRCGTFNAGDNAAHLPLKGSAT